MYNYLIINSQDTGKLSDQLLSAEETVLSDTECRKTYIDLTKQMFCAGIPIGGKAACQVTLHIKLIRKLCYLVIMNVD